jgi:acyl-coenzyme A synthetase/AMP-(fatty) acid ligase
MPEIPHNELIIINREFLSEIRNLKPDMDFYHYRDNDPICIFGTSGTTGISKNVCWNLSNLEGRAKAEKFNTGTDKKITLMNSTSNLGFYVGFSSLVYGETLFTRGSNEEVIELIQNFGLKTLHGSPSQVASLLETMIEEGTSDLFGKLEKVITAGSVISLSLLTNIKTYLAETIYSDFGSTETGFACQNLVTSAADLSSIGSPAPDVVIEIVDESDSKVSSSEVGRIRIKTPYMVTKYLNNEKDSAIFFKDGWFYPGDYAFMNDNRKISLVGRGNEIINIGGVKVNQFLIDMFFLKYPGVKDAAVFTYQNSTGLDELVVAIVSEEPINIDELKSKLITELNSSSCPKRFFKALSIPRNPNGKVSREQLAHEILNLSSATTHH